MKRIRISSSIANFEDKLRKRYADYEDFKWFAKDPTLFFGCYHIGDYLRILFHRGTKTLFWCGSDLLSVTPIKARMLKRQKILHYVENDVEWLLLRKHGIPSLVQPMFFGDANRYPASYIQADYPHVFLSAHPGRGAEYGVSRVIRIAPKVPDVTFHIYMNGSIREYKRQLRFPKNVILHPKVSEEQFDEEIRKYQAGLRLNSFDGFGEVIAKSVLLGQYPISTIPYEGVDTVLSDWELIEKLKDLSKRREPHPNRDYWFRLLNKRVEI